MEFDLRAMPRALRYKVLASCITPRPIAWITSRSRRGVLNAAPYSFFNMIGDEPLTIVVGLLAHAEGRFKDTAANILDTGQFVVNLVDHAHAQAMNLTCVDAPADVDEVQLADLATQASVVVAPPRIATAPASFECQVLHALATGPHQLAVIAEVVFGHVQDAFIEDGARGYIDTPAMDLIARLHGAGWYVRAGERFQMERPTWADWAARPDAANTR